MTTIRRIYAYLLAFAGLAMLSLAAANLLQLLVDLVLRAPVATGDRYVRDTVSWWVAAALVGLPVWLLHWLWTERSARSDPHERASILRRLYLYVVLVGATSELAGAVRDTLSSAFAMLVGVPPPGATTLDGIVRPLPFAVIGLGVWLVHWRIAARDRALIGERGGSATVRRWYLYGTALVGVVLLLTGTQAVVESLWRLLAHAGGPPGIDLPGPASDALVGLALWGIHWFLLPHRLAEADSRADETSVLRSVSQFLALLLAVTGGLFGLSQLLYYAVGRLLGVDRPGGVGGDLFQAAAGPGSITIVYGAAWLYQRQALRRQSPGAAAAPRQAGVRRLYTYLVALVALGVLVSGVAGLLWTLGDVLFPDSAATIGSVWREQVALFATMVGVGLPVWLRHWQPTATSPTETRSLARRLYVYISLGVGMLALVGSAAAVLYRLLGLALGGSFNLSVAADLSHAVAVAAVSSGLAAYQWRVLRGDAQRSQPQTTAPAPESAAAGGQASIVVEIQAPDSAALGAAMSALRATGVQVRVIANHPVMHGRQ